MRMRLRSATYSTATGSEFAGPYAERQGTIDLDAVNDVLAGISASEMPGSGNVRKIFMMPGGKTTVFARYGAGDDNVYLHVTTRRRFRVEKKLRDALDGLGALYRGGAKHMRYLLAEETDPDKDFIKSIDATLK